MDLQEVEASYNEITSSALKLIMEISINKLKNFQSTLQSSTGPLIRSIENKNNLLMDNSNRSTTIDSSQHISFKKTSNSFSPSNRLYRIMVILKIAKKARSVLLNREALNTPQTDNKSVDVQNISSSENDSNNHSYNTQQCDPVKQPRTPNLSSLQTKTHSELRVLHSNKQNEQVYQCVYDSVPNNSSVCTRNKRALDSNPSTSIPEKRAFSNFRSESPMKCDKSSHQDTLNVMYSLTTPYNTGNVENSVIKPKFNQHNDNDDEYDDPNDNDVIMYSKSYPLCKCRLSIQNSEVCGLGNGLIASNEVLLSSTSLQQMNHSMDYEEISNDYGRDMCICLSNSPNSRPLITGII
ncbi:unnamed protein product [Schistosoma mattheei]|uniref:Ras-GEF domain-containing protein n=1 Tax=Schistosoma mattheei TaxID=31246 RepID=A0A183NTB6_9TREM|nr:unnamed protein product [Schistosoma mattheei]VDP28203.1 unnamed protein product [Schistosoma mattheei]